MATRITRGARRKPAPQTLAELPVAADTQAPAPVHAPSPAEVRSRFRSALVPLRMWAPQVAVAAIVILFTLGAFYRDHHNTRFTDLIDVGVVYARHAGLQDLAVSYYGYDGQFFYYLALKPQLVVTCAHDAATCPLDDPAERSERILYPVTATLLALNQPMLLPYTLFLVNLLAILVTVVVVGQLCVDAGASRWLGAAVGLFAGEVLGLLHSLADPYGVMWAVLAVWFLRKGRPIWAAMAVAAALLTREQLLIFLPILGLPLLAQRRWLTLAQSAAVAGIPFLSWQVVLRLLYGKWALTDSASSGRLVPIPFAGLWAQRSMGHIGHLVALAALVAVPVLIALSIGLVALWRHGLRSVLHDPVPLVVVLYCLLMTLTGAPQWGEIVSPTRLAAPGVVLGGVVAAIVPRPLRVCLAFVLWVSSAALALAFVTAIK